MTNTQSPQASASTNSAIRAQIVNTDELSQENGLQSSASATDVSLPEQEIALQNRAHGAGGVIPDGSGSAIAKRRSSLQRPNGAGR